MRANSFLSDDSKAAMVSAIKAVEARSSAEVVIAVEPRAHSYIHVGLAAAIVAATAFVAFLLFSPWPFPLWQFLAMPLAGGTTVGLVVARVPALGRAFSGLAARNAAVEKAAAASFFERGVRLTSDRVGILVFVSLYECQARVLCDVGVTDAVPTEDWANAIARVTETVSAGQDGAALAGRIEDLADILEPALPRSDDDINELADEVHA